MKHRAPAAKTRVAAAPAGKPAAKTIDLLYAVRRGLKRSAG